MARRTFTGKAGSASRVRNSIATGSFLGRISKGRGPIEQLTVGDIVTGLQKSGGISQPSIQALLDSIGNTRGDILYRGAAGWAVLAPGSSGKVLTIHGAGADPTWETPSGGGGYSPGSPPSWVQSAFATNGGNSVTFGVAPTNGNLLVAMAFNPTSPSAGSGWTAIVTNSSGTDYGTVLTKTAGAGESTTQTPMSGVGADGALVVWEVSGANGTNPLAYSQTQAEQSGSAGTIPVQVSNAVNCLGLSAVGVASATNILAGYNGGTQDALDNANSRKLFAGHTDLSKTPIAGVIALCNGSATSKSATVLVRS